MSTKKNPKSIRKIKKEIAEATNKKTVMHKTYPEIAATRKLKRSILRTVAEKRKVKPSRFVHNEFMNMQIKKYGAERYFINVAKGTHTKDKYAARIAMFANKRNEANAN